MRRSTLWQRNKIHEMWVYLHVAERDIFHIAHTLANGEHAYARPTLIVVGAVNTKQNIR